MNDTIFLNNGVAMPRLGLGVYKAAADGEVQSAIKDAFSVGYRLIDTASVYRNEEGVGAALKALRLPREAYFITTKVWNTAQRLGDVENAFNRSLERLGLEYVDLYLIHWPVPGYYEETWRVLEKLYRDGRVRAIGVSNFNERQLTEIMTNFDIVPAVNQIEYHPLWNRQNLLDFCRRNGIVVQAYAPLARGAYLNRAVIEKIADKYHRTTAQIGLRWLLQKDICPIPKSVHPARILSNYQIFDFELDEVEMQTLDSMNENFRSANIPDDLKDQLSLDDI
ncbi:MAG: aldo/keto reductase [Lachnospiraceae bacterium]|nr:aldo/keto reductase [Lachnospiraceae bacterium]